MQLNAGTPLITTSNNANQISSAGFSYDNAGNLRSDGTANYSYAALDSVRRTVMDAGTPLGVVMKIKK